MIRILLSVLLLPYSVYRKMVKPSGIYTITGFYIYKDEEVGKLCNKLLFKTKQDILTYIEKRAEDDKSLEVINIQKVTLRTGNTEWVECDMGDKYFWISDKSYSIYVE